ncbi:MAG: diaminopimelate epimerase [Bacteroidales bacterium]|nr:diaminopimelate epimerase [Bacteroidales bacterium]
MNFLKLDGAGNDFVVFDNRSGGLRLSQSEVARICNRRCGVGADGLLLLNASSGDADFDMAYFNSDGSTGMMCGNGGRCIALFAMLLGIGSRLRFNASDGVHEASVLQWDAKQRSGLVRLGMKDVEKKELRPILQGWYVNTGAPHYVQPVNNLQSFDVENEGRKLRYCEELFPGGTNVDFVEMQGDGGMAVRTYERGVESETLACGTGVTASALVTGCKKIAARGGLFEVDYIEDSQAFARVSLTGPVALNFTGEWLFDNER